MIGLPWWIILLAVIVIVTIVYTVRGFLIARRCREILKRDGEETAVPEVDEDSKAGDADVN